MNNHIICFDIETAPLDLEHLESVYQAPVFEDFASSCDQRWKPDTVERKFQEHVTDHKAKFMDRAPLNAHTAQVVIATVRRGGGTYIFGGKDREKDTLQFLWDELDAAKQEVKSAVGYNIVDFDVPMICRRSMLLGVHVPQWVWQRRRFLHDCFVDLRQVWECGQRGVSTGGLDGLLKIFGREGKGSGKLFYQLWEEDRAAAFEYVKHEIQEIEWLANRMLH